MNDYDVNMELAVESVREGDSVAKAARTFNVNYWMLRNKCLKHAWYSDIKTSRKTSSTMVKRKRQARKMFREGIGMKEIAATLGVHERTIYAYVQDIRKGTVLTCVPPAPKPSFLSRMFGWMWR